MNLNFYHWHNRVELKPDTSVLPARWAAAAEFAENLTKDFTCSLLRLALYGQVSPEFSKHFSEVLVKSEPTFPTEDNLELLRVMATAALHSALESSSHDADAIAMGFLAGTFGPDRANPICKDLGIAALKYLASESELVRPTQDIGSEYQALNDATHAEGWADNPESRQLIGKAVLELGESLRRIAEENQFVWWLLSRRSSLLGIRRDKISSKEYFLVAAAEAAERVSVLPPPVSVGALIDEVLTHCAKSSNGTAPLADLVRAANIGSLNAVISVPGVRDLCPLVCLVERRRRGNEIDGQALQELNIPVSFKISPGDLANQYFRELTFLRGLACLG